MRLKVTKNREKRTIKLLQSGYIEKLLDCYGICKAKTVKIFVQDMILLLSDTLTSELKKAKYVTNIGSIIYAIVESRVNIAFAIFMVSRFAKNSSLEHFYAIDQILCYLAGS